MREGENPTELPPAGGDGTPAGAINTFLGIILLLIL